MSLNSMARRMSLEVPGLPDNYAAILLNEALGFIEDGQLWSFQLQEGGFLTPGLLFPGGPGVSLGTATFTPYSNQVVGDAAASAQWSAYVAGGKLPLITQFQIRSPFYSLYNIVAYSATQNSPFFTFTLDRVWMEPGGVGQSYMIYQAYFPVPVIDFKRFFTVRDTTNNSPLDYWSKTQKDLAVQDPQRTYFNQPSYLVPYQTDQRLNSSTLNFMLYEMWPHPLSVLPYSFNFLRKGPQLLSPNDTVPYPITEEALLWRAKSSAYLFKEAQKGEEMQRGSGADYRFLAQAADAEHAKLMKPIKERDRDRCDLYWSKVRQDWFNYGEPYSNMNGDLSVGRM